ncbi:hypothetical protein PEBR_37508 [Penicillium brasilianum]|uniref:Uncharacterized protein n=1 Tax=Penicillium brasilianum TaxID=104259 RepID=A0A1S9RB94_PENBI|nr:hypothetical protein PEBR_37508 [Penicillium brasilianum]
MNAVGNWSLQMPGFNQPLNAFPDPNVLSGYYSGFPNALDPEHLEPGYLNKLLTKREINMMRIMNIITDKPEWERKVFDEHIIAKWREEVAKSGQDASPKMMDWIVKELQWKAGILQQSGFVEVFDAGVVKSDTAVSKELQRALKEAVLPFENVPKEEKDYHPGSDDKVVDLVHPSLFPVIYGRTYVLPDRTIGLDDCIDSMGEGEWLERPKEAEATPEAVYPYYILQRLHPAVLSTKFQWLPCDVKLIDDGRCQILSYINNAHPVKHRALYEVVEKILAQTVPLWEQSLSEKEFFNERIKFTKVEYEDDGTDEPKHPEGHEETDSEEYDRLYDEYEDRMVAWYKARKIIQPEPGEFKPRESEEKAIFLKHFPEGKIQVIVKLANIELTPEKPDYEGGSWHIEGQLNERIAASAIYYYDSENITPSSLAFRHRGMDDMMDISYEQSQHEFLQQIYGFHEDFRNHNIELITQELGSVVSKEGRIITFPNTLQHQVSPFSLADPSKPGHRKIIALFLVDPHLRIISSANVPPQREDWRPETQKHGEGAQQVLDGEAVNSITMEEAKAYRVELMAERGLQSQKNNDAFQTGEFCLCEH